MIRTKRIVGIILSLTLVLGASNVGAACADSNNKWGLTPSVADAYARPDVTVEVNGKIKNFKNIEGQAVYPLIYGNTTYLPVRAISALLKENLEWVNDTNTVFIGKTLSNPNKSTIKNNIDTSAVVDASVTPSAITGMGKISVTIRPDITVLFDFKTQSFQDSAGQSLYPIMYEGNIYLPARSIFAIVGERIELDNGKKTLFIGDKPSSSDIPIVVKASVTTLSNELENSIEIYDQATDAIAKIHKATDDDQLLQIANSVSDSLQKSKEETAKLKALNVSEYNAEEMAAYKALFSFSEASEYYILILENISYMAASKVNYSMLEEAFMNYAMDSQTRMDLARDAIENLYDEVY